MMQTKSEMRTWLERWAGLLLIAPLLAASVAIGAFVPARAAEACSTVINGQTIKQSIVVPTNAICILHDTVVRGGVTVEAGGSLGTFDT
jgi:hypothetical protein